MWLVTKLGFYSVVAHRNLPADVLVRARAREDLERLGALVGPFDIAATPEGDYPWRAVIPRERWSVALVLLASEIDYGNFKAAVAERQGSARAGVYHDVWAVLDRISVLP